MTLRQASKSILTDVLSEITSALTAIGTEYGLKVKATPSSATAHRAVLRIVITDQPEGKPTRTKTLAGALAKAASVKRGFPVRSAATPKGAITLLVDENPHQKGTKAFRTFEALRKCDTVDDYKSILAKYPEKYHATYISWAQQPHGTRPALIKVK